MTGRLEPVTENDMMHYVATVGPIAIEMYVDSPFYSYSSGVYQTPCPSPTPTVNHGVLLGKRPVENHTIIFKPL